MPIYEFRCDECSAISSVLWRGETRMVDVACDGCGGKTLSKIISGVSVHRNMSSKMSSLDPKYDKMIDQAVSRSPLTDPQTHLNKLKNFKSD